MLDTIQWLGGVVKLVKREAIRACFTKANFIDNNDTNEKEKNYEHVECA